MAETYNYDAVIPWHVLKAHLEMLEHQVGSQLKNAEGIEVYKLQGEARRLDSLKNLPQTLALLAEDQFPTKKEGQNGKRSRHDSQRAA